MLDWDLETLFDLETRRLNEQVRKNTMRFPPQEFEFQVPKEEFEHYRSQISCNNTKNFEGKRNISPQAKLKI